MHKLLFIVFLLQPFLMNGQITEEKFLELKKTLTPDSSEPWKTIPWKLSVLEAQKEAVQTKKPIFIWAMDGHPLACV